MAPMSLLQTFLWIPFMLIVCVHAATRSTVVDDSDKSRIVYFPLGTWNPGNECTTCFANPDKARALDGTWRDNTASNDQPNVYFNFTFTGTAVEVRCILYNRIVTWIGNTNVTYSIDGVYQGTASHNPTNATEFLYNQTLFRVGDLANTEHTLQVNLLKPSMLLFDYLVYDEDVLEGTSSTGINGPNETTPTSPTSSPIADTSGRKGINIVPIIGGIVAGVSVVGCAILWFRYKRYKERRERLERIAEPSPLMLENFDTAHIPFQGKSAAHFTLPQPKPDIKSTATSGASPESTTPLDISPYSNPQDCRSGAPPPGHGAFRASTTVPSFVSTRATVVAPTAPDTIHDDLRTSWDGIPGMAFHLHDHIGPPSGFHPPAVVGGVHEASLEEPVEAGQMSRHASTPPSSSSMPPPYNG